MVEKRRVAVTDPAEYSTGTEQALPTAAGRLLVLLFSLLFGVGVALALTLFMHVLIQSTEADLNEKTSRVQNLDFVRVRKEENTQRKERTPERPITEAPSTPPVPTSQSAASQRSGLAVSAPSFENAAQGALGDSGAVGFGQQEGEYLPIVKPQPLYPLQAMRRGIEGTCMVSYTVTATGSTRDVRVVPGQCSNDLFREVSIEAARKFKYKPRVLNGEAIEVPGVRNRFIYELSDQ